MTKTGITQKICKFQTHGSFSAMALFAGIIISAGAFAQGGNQNVSGWEKVGMSVKLTDTSSSVNIGGSHIATEKADIDGNIRVRMLEDLPNNTPAANKLMFRSLYVDNTGRFYRGAERHDPEMPEIPVHRVGRDTTLGCGGGLWFPNFTIIYLHLETLGLG